MNEAHYIALSAQTEANLSLATLAVAQGEADGLDLDAMEPLWATQDKAMSDYRSARMQWAEYYRLQALRHSSSIISAMHEERGAWARSTGEEYDTAHANYKKVS